MKMSTMAWMGRLPVALAFVACGVFALPRSAVAELDPKSYRSPSGRWELAVDPVERSGAGAARYELRFDGMVAWSGERPYAFVDVRLTDDGTAGGYAYGAGEDSAANDFVVAILDAKGRARLVQRTPRVGSRYLHTGADPKASGGLLVVDGHLLVRVEDADANAGSEYWWTYRLRDGRVLPKIRPRTLQKDAQVLGRLVAANTVAGTPLLLAQWMRTDEGACGECRLGTRFALVDRLARPIWTLDLPGDYELPDRYAEARLFADIGENGAILDTSQERHFEVHQFATGERLGFAIESGPRHGKWKVTPTGRSAFVSPRPPSPDPVDVGAPRKLGTIVLQGGSPQNPSPVHDVYAFAIGGAGQFAFVDSCCDGASSAALVIVDAGGKLERWIALPDGVSASGIQLAWVEGNRWLLTHSPIADDVHSSAWWVNVSDGRAALLEGFEAPEIKAIASTRDGGFIALVTTRSPFGMMGEEMRAYDARGARRWTVEGGESHGPGIFSAEDVAVAPSGEIVVLENIADNIKVYGSDGHFVRAVALEKAWGRKPNYPTAIAIDGAGDAIVLDGRTLVRMTLQGKVKAKLEPAYPDGRRFDVRGNVRVGPDARAWISDGDAFLRLDDKGIVDRVVGEAPDGGTLGDVAGMLVTTAGEIYAVDERTGSVHRYDANGRHVRVYRPNLDDYSERAGSVRVNRPGDGKLYVTRGNDGWTGSGTSIVYADDDGHRIGAVPSPVQGASADWIAQPGLARRWLLAYEGISLAGTDGTIVKRIERDAHRHWLRPGPAAVAPDGSLAIISNGAIMQSVTMWQREGYGTLALYSAQGDAVDAWAAPQEAADMELAYDGERIAFLAGLKSPGPDHVVVTDIHGRVLHRFKPQVPPRYIHLVHGVDGRELWVSDGKSRIARYALQ